MASAQLVVFVYDYRCADIATRLTVPGETILMRTISGGSFLVKTATVMVRTTSLVLPTTSLPAHPSPLTAWLSLKPV